MIFNCLKFSVVLSIALLAGCNGTPSIKINTNNDSAASVLKAGATLSDSAKIVDMITELYNKYVFGDENFDSVAAERFCTRRLIEKLKADYELEYDGDGLAVWNFRTDAQDSAEGDGMVSVAKKAENVYSVVLYDDGVKADVDLFIVIEDGVAKIGAVDVSYKKKCYECSGRKEIRCPSCNGEGFVYTPNENQGEDWGRGCFDCGGRGFGHKSGNDGNPLTIGKGVIPCPVCVKEIEVQVPQSSDAKTLESVSPDLESKLVGNHGVRLQWISEKRLGNVNIAKLKDGLYECVGSQSGDGNDDYVRLNGKIKVVSALHLVFEGTIECRVSHIHKGKPYIRKGTMDFLNTKGRKFWRLQQMENGDCTDYVDIYM